MTAVTSSVPGFLLREKNGSDRLPFSFYNRNTTLGFRVCPKMVGSRLRRRAVMRSAFTRSRLRCYGALPCLAVSQLSVAPNGSDGLVLWKRLTAAPLPCAACGLISLDERRRLPPYGKRRKMPRKTRKKWATTWSVVLLHSYKKWPLVSVTWLQFTLLKVLFCFKY